MKSHLTRWLMGALGCLCIVYMPHVDALRKTACKEGERPIVKTKIANWDIIATNVGSIPTATAFSGDKLVYSVYAKPKNSQNIVKINAKTGQITIKAEAKDLFDVKVTAKNSCGAASTTFNVEIDEEE
jgi:hypothetical protein